MLWFHKFKTAAVALKRESYTLYLACRDPRCPWYARLLAAGVVAYALSPIDLIPDFIPVLGLLDDFIIVPFGIVMARRLMPAEVFAEARVRAAEELSQGGSKPVLWSGAVIIVAAWLLAAWFGVRAILAWW